MQRNRAPQPRGYYAVIRDGQRIDHADQLWGGKQRAEQSAGTSLDWRPRDAPPDDLVAVAVHQGVVYRVEWTLYATGSPHLAGPGHTGG